MFGMGQGLTAIVLIVALVLFFGTIREVAAAVARARVAKWTAQDRAFLAKPHGSVNLEQARANGEI
jgi:hypothetical protein